MFTVLPLDAGMLQSLKARIWRVRPNMLDIFLEVDNPYFDIKARTTATGIHRDSGSMFWFTHHTAQTWFHLTSISSRNSVNIWEDIAFYQTIDVKT